MPSKKVISGRKRGEGFKMKISMILFCHSFILSCHCLGWDFKYSQYEKGNVRQCSLTLPYSAWESSWNLNPVRNPKYGYEIVSARTDCSCELSMMLLPLFRNCLPRPITCTGILQARRAVWLLAISLRLNSIKRCCALIYACLSFACFDDCELPFVVAVSFVLKWIMKIELCMQLTAALT